MDIYKYIRSRDIREYNQKIEHRFTALESAFLVWHNSDLTLEEKHKAWREIMRDMPDERVEYRGKSQCFDSLFALLEQFINDDDMLVDEFYKQDDQAVYSCKFTDDGSWYNDFGRVYADFDYMRCQLSTILPDRDRCIVVYTKKYFSSPYKHVELVVNKSGQIKNVVGRLMLSNESVPKDNFFESLWVDIPTPFKVGDIVCGATAPICCGLRVAGEEPFVLKSISNWDGKMAVQRGEKLTSKEITNKTKNVAMLKETGNIRNMCVFGYFSHVVWSDEIEGEFYGSSAYDYVDLEYYRGTIEEGLRILLPLSRYLQDDIDEETLIRLCEIIKKQQEIKRTISLLELDSEQLRDLGVE